MPVPIPVTNTGCMKEELVFPDKNRKDSGTVMPLGRKKRMAAVSVARRVFKDEPALVIQKRYRPFRQFVDGSQGVRGTRKDQVEAVAALFQELKNVHPDRFVYGSEAKLGGRSLDKSEHCAVLFHYGEVADAAGGELIADAAGSPKKIEGFQRGKVEIVFEDIKESLPGDIGGRAGVRHFRRRVDPSSTE